MSATPEKHIPKSGLLILTQADTVTRLTTDGKRFFQKLWLYPASNIAGFKLVANASNIFVGKEGAGEKVTPDKLTPTDLPIKYELPEGTQMALESVIVQGAVGDGIYFCYW